MKNFLFLLIFSQMSFIPLASSADDLDQYVALLTVICKGEIDNTPVEFSIYSTQANPGKSAIIGYKSFYNSVEFSYLIKSSLELTPPVEEINEHTKSLHAVYTLNYPSRKDKIVIDSSLDNSSQVFINAFWDISSENKKIPLTCVFVQQPRWPSP